MTFVNLCDLSILTICTVILILRRYQYILKENITSINRHALINEWLIFGLKYSQTNNREYIPTVQIDTLRLTYTEISNNNNYMTIMLINITVWNYCMTVMLVKITVCVVHHCTLK